MDDLDGGINQRSSKPILILKGLQQRYQKLLDDATPYTVGRWVFAAVLVLFFLARVLIMQGWYIITYGLGIYHLNLFIAFITPRTDPALEFSDDGGPELPTRANEEFRPFIRRLPEFKFWYSVSKSTLIGLFCTFFECFNIPVFWPILVMYFLVLFGVTMKRQIKHMFRYRYVPFTYGKPKYQSFGDSGKVPLAPVPTHNQNQDLAMKVPQNPITKPTVPLVSPNNVI